MFPRLGAVACLVFASSSLLATSFVAPTDAELLLKSEAVVTGTVEGTYVQEFSGVIETVTEIRVARVIKGAVRPAELLRSVSEGGFIAGRGVHVEGVATFKQGEDVLLFLMKDEKGRWATTDLTLGKFRFVTSTKGERLLVRDMEDVVGWDQTGRVHHERIRREAQFLRFLREEVTSQREADYFVDASEVTIPPVDTAQDAMALSFSPATYTSWVSDLPIQWPTMGGSIAFYKRSDQHISGAADGGVSTIQSGLAAWTNECGSLINLAYSGQKLTPSANHDSSNMIEFNDPQGRVSGTWTGAGTIAITFMSLAGSHSFAGTTWWNITEQMWCSRMDIQPRRNHSRWR